MHNREKQWDPEEGEGGGPIPNIKSVLCWSVHTEKQGPKGRGRGDTKYKKVDCASRCTQGETVGP